MIELQRVYSPEWSRPVWALSCQNIVIMAWLNWPFDSCNAIDCDHSDFKSVFDGTAQFEREYIDSDLLEEYQNNPDVSRTLDWNHRARKSLFNGSNY